MEPNRPVVIKHVPTRLSLRDARSFFREIQPFLAADHPQIVFDLSLVEQMDSAGVEMLLECMTECMKHDGDLKLSSLSPHSATVLELTRTDRVFEIYETSTEAVRSFTGFMPELPRKKPATLVA